MPVDPFSPANDAWPSPGTALFRTTPGTPYHVMLVAPATQGAEEEGISSVSEEDETIDKPSPLKSSEVSTRIFHMAPPLEAADIDSNEGPFWKARFTETSQADLDNVLAEAERLIKLMPVKPAGFIGIIHQYTLSEHGIAEESPRDQGGRVPVRASCASFVEHCYAQAGMDLVDKDSVPALERTVLYEHLKLSEEFVNFLRLVTKDLCWPCRVLLPAYQLRAFEADKPDQPRRAALTDHPYPALSTTQENPDATSTTNPPCDGKESDVDGPNS